MKLMKLSKDDKEYLKSLAHHPGWTVLKRIEEENKYELLDQFSSADLDEPKVRIALREQQIYCKARTDFILLCESNL